ncbi:MAG: hypothetical protein HY520_03750 [Candidatus Aenigmarchaeota archaeon]|nr:hypothetical protein [Candidatus Aenigmarchaeota archaeon]
MRAEGMEQQIIIVGENRGAGVRRYDVRVCLPGDYPPLPDTFDIVYKDWPLSAREVAHLLPLADAALGEATRSGFFDWQEYESSLSRLRSAAGDR